MALTTSGRSDRHQRERACYGSTRKTLLVESAVLSVLSTQFATELLKLAFDPMSTHSYALRTNITKALTGVATDN